MTKSNSDKDSETDLLFLKAEQLANEFSLFPNVGKSRQDPKLSGVLNNYTIDTTAKRLRKLKVDKYIEKTVLPAELKSRPGARSILKKIGGEIIQEISMGPLYALEVKLSLDGPTRRVGFLTQERTSNNGVWLPEHHAKAVDIIREFSECSIPLVTFIDTPGADAGELANRNNQAHSISRLITEMSMLDIPTVGVILGNGYSGGAIPLATTNILLSVKDGVFNTIQPRGLASIARKYNLSWQECAKYVGVSAYELYKQGYIDGIIDYFPSDGDESIDNLRDAIVSSILSIEESTKNFVLKNGYVFDHYRRSTHRYLSPSDHLDHYLQKSALSLPHNPTSQLNVFGAVYRYLRYLTLRKRIRSTTTGRYGRLSQEEIPKGDLQQRIDKEHREAFLQWVNEPLETKYDAELNKAWKNYQYFRDRLPERRSKLKKFILGDPKENYHQSISELKLSYTFHLLNLWKAGASNNFKSLIEYLLQYKKQKEKVRTELTIVDVITQEELRFQIIDECKNVFIFDLIYDGIIHNLTVIAKEAHETNVITENTIRTLLESSLKRALKTSKIAFGEISNGKSDCTEAELCKEYLAWLEGVIKDDRFSGYLKAIEEWKKLAFPRISETLFAIVTYFFEQLVPRYLKSKRKPKGYNGSITPRNIGIKDFWNRLTIAYHDLLMQEVLSVYKKRKETTADVIIDKFFIDFSEVKAKLMTSDPANFPGFRISIEDALQKGVTPCGTKTGIGNFRSKNIKRKVGVIVSNLDFQAGAFDMASAEKVCNLLVLCSAKNYPVISFISSGGMQTKEGAGALFSMAIVNDRITRFVRDNDLPFICFGFGDCTGGAQASMVTHPLVQTYYFSGTNMPFAGQIVVPSYLPTMSTLSNYLSTVPGSMQGFVKHPFFEDLDSQLQEIDPAIPVATESVEEVVTRILRGDLSNEEDDTFGMQTVNYLDVMKPVKRVLIHARGCTAVKLIRIAQEKGIKVVLVQSDADMDSVAADALTNDDTLVCLGGNTSDESYLNALSVVRIAEREQVDSLHPGIGFLSENPQFAYLCRNHQLNFIGPPVKCMELMGNKSNAINTALELKIPVVPGSHGIITNSGAAEKLANEIGFPIVIKAVHGGGGKGIRMVHSGDNFHEIFVQMMAEAKSAFGNSDVYIEKCVTSLRHIEVQILGDRLNNTKVLGLRDCSVQRDNQKIIEESGSTLLTEKLKKAAFKYSSAIADRVEYIGAGTVEFIFDLKAQEIYFMEMNTRLQVEHPVTESTAGIDIVGAQFDIASGKSIKKLEVKDIGYAMEVRINAEKVALDAAGDMTFIPDPGEITEYHFPQKDHIDIISTVEKEKLISSYYDSLIIQLICKGKDRKDTIEKLLEYLGTVRISGICTNIPLLKLILADNVFNDGEYDTTFLTHFFSRIDKKKLIRDTEKFAGESRRQFDANMIKIEDSDELKVVAPSSGIFYSTPSPTEPLFVNIGETISVHKTLCLIEAMKVFQPISLKMFNIKEDDDVYPQGQHYQIVKIYPANGQIVNTGDLLFIIKPVSN